MKLAGQKAWVNGLLLKEQKSNRRHASNMFYSSQKGECHNLSLQRASKKGVKILQLPKTRSFSLSI